MKQLVQSVIDGQLSLIDTPVPRVKDFCVLVETEYSVVSPGTEKSLISFGRAGLIRKAKLQPEKLRQIQEKIKTDGLFQTLNSVQSRALEPLPLGYSSVGRILAVGRGVSGFQKGDRVVSNGSHAEVSLVPASFVAKIPQGVSPEDAVFSVLGAVSLQGVRLVAPTIGESIAVLGLGVIGVLACQVLQAGGCEVIGLDISQDRVDFASELGIPTMMSEDSKLAIREVVRNNGGYGVDGVVVATASEDSQVMATALELCRKRGRVVLIGTAGLNLQRSDFYEKEVSFQVSSSYGPGRYDHAYENLGVDFPREYVRWTAGRNIEAFLTLISRGKVMPARLAAQVAKFDDAPRVYENIIKNPKILTVILEYERSGKLLLPSPSEELGASLKEGAGLGSGGTNNLRVDLVGAGNFAKVTLAPLLKRSGFELGTVFGGNALSAAHLARRFGFQSASTEIRDAFGEGNNGALFIATRHDSHAELAAQALHAGINVYVEKPLGLDHSQIDVVEKAWRATRNDSRPPILMVGFNRRFAPLIQDIKRLTAQTSGPRFVSIRVNAGQVPISHWLMDPMVGGGPILGEGCHFVDLLRFLIGAPISSWHCASIDEEIPRSAVISFNFADGSVGAIEYCSEGSRLVPKERLEIAVGGRNLVLNNFRGLKGYGWPAFSSKRTLRQDKGHSKAVNSFLKAAAANQTAPIPFHELIEVSRVVVEIAEDIATRRH